MSAGVDNKIYNNLLYFAGVIMRRWGVTVVEREDIVHEAWDFIETDIRVLKGLILKVAGKYAKEEMREIPMSNWIEIFGGSIKLDQKAVSPTCIKCGYPVRVWGHHSDCLNTDCEESKRAKAKYRYSIDAEYRKRRYVSSYECRKRRLANDPVYREKHRLACSEREKIYYKKIKHDPEYKKKRRIKEARRRANMTEQDKQKQREYCREWRLKKKNQKQYDNL